MRPRDPAPEGFPAAEGHLRRYSSLTGVPAPPQARAGSAREREEAAGQLPIGGLRHHRARLSDAST